MLTKKQVQEMLMELEELNLIVDDNIIKRKDEAINRIDEMIKILEIALSEYEK